MTDPLPTLSVSDLLIKFSMQMTNPSPGLAEYQNAVVTLAGVFDHIVDHPNHNDFITVYDFFQAHSSGYLRESEIVRGSHILVGGTKLKFFLVYSNSTAIAFKPSITTTIIMPPVNRWNVTTFSAGLLFLDL